MLQPQFFQRRCSKLLIFCSVFLNATMAMGQIQGDSTLPINTRTARQGGMTTISGGTQRGSSLFHSFSEFSLPQGEAALFNNARNLTTIYARVTGNQRSRINGRLTTQNNADLFFLNPNGINFGRNADVNIKGSFIATTAQSIRFDNGESFSATQPSQIPLLSIRRPTGLTLNRPTPISLNGNGNNLIIDPDTFEVIPTGPRFGIRVPERKTVALIGGPIDLNGGNITASSGRIVLGSYAEQGQVDIAQDGLGFTFESASNNIFDAIALHNASSLITSGRGGGTIQVEGSFVDILDGSTLFGTSFGDLDGRGISVRATEELIVEGAAFNPAGEPIFISSIFAEVGFGAPGNASNLSLSAPFIFIGEGAQVSTSTFGFGKGGNISVRSADIELFGGTETFGASGFYLLVGDEGDGGRLNMRTQTLNILGGATIDGSNLGFGRGAELKVLADEIVVSGGAPVLGPSALVASVESIGRGGDIILRTKDIKVLGGASVSTSALAEGSGGNITVEADEVLISGASPSGMATSNIASLVGQSATGQGGNITVNVGRLNIQNDGEIIASTDGAGNSGSIDIVGDRIQLTGQDNTTTGIFAAVEGDEKGQGGLITITGNELRVEQGAQIVTGTRSPGDANQLTVNATQVILDGTNNVASSGLFASALVQDGAGGDVVLNAERLFVLNGASIAASNVSTSPVPPPPGSGPAGNIAINAARILLQNQGTITATTQVGDRGNINITGDLLVLDNQSQIIANAFQNATGGNIDINVRNIVATAGSNSDISANAVRGRGGNLTILSQGVYGIEFRPALTSGNDITASSEFGQAGIVTLDTSTDTTDELGQLPGETIDESDRVAVGCPADKGANFIASGRGGLPDNLSYQVQSPILLNSFERTLSQQAAQRRSPLNTRLSARQNQRPQYPVEAKGWSVADNGQIHVYADPNPSNTLTAQNCLKRRAG